MTEQQQRAAVVAEARTWLRTPFIDCARTKGAGCDCGGLLIGVYRAAGVIQQARVPLYSPQFMLHSSEERYIATILAHGAHEITEAELAPGDIVTWMVGRCHSHSAIVLDYPKIIHALKNAGGVVYGDVERDRFLASRERRYFSFWPQNPSAE